MMNKSRVAFIVLALCQDNVSNIVTDVNGVSTPLMKKEIQELNVDVSKDNDLSPKEDHAAVEINAEHSAVEINAEGVVGTASHKKDDNAAAVTASLAQAKDMSKEAGGQPLYVCKKDDNINKVCCRQQLNIADGDAAIEVVTNWEGNTAYYYSRGIELCVDSPSTEMRADCCTNYEMKPQDARALVRWRHGKGWNEEPIGVDLLKHRSESVYEKEGTTWSSNNIHFFSIFFDIFSDAVVQTDLKNREYTRGLKTENAHVAQGKHCVGSDGKAVDSVGKFKAKQWHYAGQYGGWTPEACFRWCFGLPARGDSTYVKGHLDAAAGNTAHDWYNTVTDPKCCSFAIIHYDWGKTGNAAGNIETKHHLRCLVSDSIKTLPSQHYTSLLFDELKTITKEDVKLQDEFEITFTLKISPNVNTQQVTLMTKQFESRTTKWDRDAKKFELGQSNGNVESSRFKGKTLNGKLCYDISHMAQVCDSLREPEAGETLGFRQRKVGSTGGPQVWVLEFLQGGDKCKPTTRAASCWKAADYKNADGTQEYWKAFYLMGNKRDADDTSFEYESSKISDVEYKANPSTAYKAVV